MCMRVRARRTHACVQRKQGSEILPGASCASPRRSGSARGFERRSVCDVAFELASADVANVSSRLRRRWCSSDSCASPQAGGPRPPSRCALVRAPASGERARRCLGALGCATPCACARAELRLRGVRGGQAKDRGRPSQCCAPCDRRRHRWSRTRASPECELRLSPKEVEGITSLGPPPVQSALAPPPPLAAGAKALSVATALGVKKKGSLLPAWKSQQQAAASPFVSCGAGEPQGCASDCVCGHELGKYSETWRRRENKEPGRSRDWAEIQEAAAQVGALEI